jgi:DamX protein
MQKKDLLPVLVIDDAHLMAQECLEFLCRIQEQGTEKESPWRLVMFTDPTMMSALMQQTFRQHYLQLNPFSRDQIEKYLLHRLKIAGLQGELPFTEDDIDHIEMQSGGIATGVNQAAHDCLMAKFGQSAAAKPAKPPKTREKKPGKRFPWKKLALWLSIPIIAVLLLLALLYQEQINQLFRQGPNLSSSQIRIADEPRYLVRKVPKTVTIIRANPFTPPTPVEKPVKKVESPKAAPVSPPPAAKEPKQVKQQTTPKINVPEQKTAEAPVATTRKTAPSKTAVARPIASLPAWLRQQSWVMSQNPAHYSIQLAASSTTDVLLNLAANPALKDIRAMYRIKRNGADWYVLLHGTYKSKLQAIRASRKLPRLIQRNRPWVRKLADIQAEIEKGHK